MILYSTILSQEWRFCKIGANKNPFEKDWPNKPYKASQIKFGQHTKAAGVICGPLSGGLIVVDIDGDAAEKRWAKLGDIPESVSWTSGKPHRRAIAFWAYEEDWDSIGTASLLKGVKGQELVLQWTGQQAVLLGVHPETGGYEWINSPEDVEIAIAPDWLTDLMLRTPREESNPDLDALLNGDHLTAKELLKRLPVTPYAEQYDTWLKVGGALNAVSATTGVDLFEDWVRWSEGAYNACSPEEYEAKWETFHRNPGDNGAAGLGSLFYLVDQAEVGEAFKSEDLMEEQELETPLNVSLDELKTNWYYVAIENKYCHIGCPLQLLPPVNLNTRFLKEGVKGASKKIKKSVDSINWYPGKAIIYTDTGNRVLNLHRPYPKGAPGDISLFRELVEYLFPREAELLYDFMAYTLQRPGDKINFAPYMVGMQGIGKNFIWEPIKQALSQEFHCIHDDNRQSQYNDYLLGRKLVIIDEPMNMSGSRFVIANELKGLIATTGKDDRLHINGKYRSYIEQVHLTNFVILTNFADAIQVKGERRFYPCYSSATPKSSEFYNRFQRWLDGGGTDSVIYWLNQRDVSRFDPKIAPKTTESLDDVISDSKTELAEAIDEFIQEHQAVAFSECRAITKHLLHKNGSGTDLITKNTIHELGHCYLGGRQGEKKIKFEGKTINFRVVHTDGIGFDEAFESIKSHIKDHNGMRPWPESIPPPMF